MAKIDITDPSHVEAILDAVLEEVRPTEGVIVLIFDSGQCAHASALKPHFVQGKTILDRIKHLLVEQCGEAVSTVRIPALKKEPS